jgi:hypothetical protein
MKPQNSEEQYWHDNLPAAFDMSIGWNSMGMTVLWPGWIADFSFANLEKAGHFRMQLIGFYIKIWWHKGGGSLDDTEVD